MKAEDDVVVRVVVILTLGAVIGLAIIGITVVAVATDRDLFRAELLTFAGVVLLAALGGVSWWSLRRRRWRLQVDRNGTPPPASRDLDVFPDPPGHP